MLEAILRQQPHYGRSLFVDMNSFFASVEQELHPEYRDKPLGVCPFLNDATCIIAASIEAKRYGVRTGTNIAKAKQLCPGIKLVSAHSGDYRSYHRKFKDTLEDTRCQVVVKSIDEALLLAPHDLWDQSQALAADIRQRIRLIGSQLRCSIGISSNMFLAKMGSNLKKPDGLVEIKLEDLADFYADLSLVDIHGISYRLARQFRQIGINTPLELYQAPYQLLRAHFGANGEAWYLRLRGYEVDLRPTTRRMIGHQSTIVPEPAKTINEVTNVASQLTYKAASRLRTAGLAAKGVVVYVRYSDRSSWFKVYHGKQPFYDSTSFYEHVERLLSKCPMRLPVRLVSVSAIDLLPVQQLTANLFDSRQQQERLSAALDEVNYRFGAGTLKLANQLLGAPIHDAVGFGNARDATQELPPS